MKSVFLLQHLHVINGDEENVKTIGIYSSRDAALAALNRVKQLPGFCDFPKLVVETSGVDGFYIDEYVLDLDHWDDGYVEV